MSEFKGTKGPWYLVKGDVKHIGECLSIANTSESHFQRPLICVVSNITSVNDSDKANAILISKAPEMLEMLEIIYQQVDFSFEAFGSDTGIKMEDQIKKLIKSCTEL